MRRPRSGDGRSLRLGTPSTVSGPTANRRLAIGSNARPVHLGRRVAQRGPGAAEPPAEMRSGDVRPRPAVDSRVGRYVADAEFAGQLLVSQAVCPPRS